MSYHAEDNTMDVMVSGSLQRRPVAQYERRPLVNANGQRYFAVMYWPEILPEEDCEWTIGSDVPRIIQVRPAQETVGPVGGNLP